MSHDRASMSDVFHMNATLTTIFGIILLYDNVKLLKKGGKIRMKNSKNIAKFEELARILVIKRKLG